MKIKAWVAIRPNESLREFTYERQLGDEEVLIDISYCSLSKADVFFIDNFWNDSKYPLVPSNEMFGIVTKIGSKVKNIKEGEFVGVGYQVFSCMQCNYCLKGEEQFCEKQRVLEIDEPGGLANNIIVNSNFVYSIPKDIQSPEHVSLMCYGLTAYSAIKSANLRVGAKTGVVGVGNLGHLALQILNKRGFAVTAFTHSRDKYLTLQKLGAVNFIDPTSSEKVKENINSFDFILVTTYHQYDWKDLIRLLTPRGTLCFIGLPKEDITFPAALLADYASRKVTGSYLGSRAEMKELLEFSVKYDIRAKTSIFPISKINEALSLIKEDKVPFNTVISVREN